MLHIFRAAALHIRVSLPTTAQSIFCSKKYILCALVGNKTRIYRAFPRESVNNLEVLNIMGIKNRQAMARYRQEERKTVLVDKVHKGLQCFGR
jgi:hypothetical protein